ncbi:phage tail protein [Streptomyces sp. NPDC058989]|uniref:phage tail protein n=1 Tax=Streptomyces sp. NPDC058989 TaxID=3346686 RepID=UPI0036A62A6A
MPQTGDVIQSNLFTVDLGKIQVATFQEVSGLNYGQDVVETRQVTKSGETVVRQQPGQRKMASITLSRAMDVDPTFVNWVKTTLEQKDLDGARQPVSITVLDEAKNPVQRFELTNAWVSEWSGPSLSASGSTAAVETVTIVCDEFDIAD